MGTENLTTFIIASVILITSPGVDTIYIVTRSISQGRMSGLISALGVCSGLTVHTAMAAFGLSAIIAASALLFSVVKYAGAAYLIWLGIQTLRKSQTHSFNFKAGEKLPHKWIVFRRGLLTNVLNPKPALFFFSFLPQFVAPHQTNMVFPFLILGGIFIAMAVVWCCILAVFSSSVSSVFRRNEQAGYILQKLSGLVFLGLGVKIAVERN